MKNNILKAGKIAYNKYLSIYLLNKKHKKK